MSKERLNPVVIDEIKRIEKEEKKVDRNKMAYKGYNKTYNFRKSKTICVFGDEIRNNIITMGNDEQNKLARYIKEFKTKTKPQNNSNFKKVKEDVFNSAMVLLKGRKMEFKAFKSGIFPKLKNRNNQNN